MHKDTHVKLAADGGYKSRKMVMAYVTMLMILIGFGLIAWFPALSVVYAEYCAGIITAASIYAGGNLLVKHLATKAKVDDTPPK